MFKLVSLVLKCCDKAAPQRRALLQETDNKEGALNAAVGPRGWELRGCKLQRTILGDPWTLAKGLLEILRSLVLPMFPEFTRTAHP